MLTEKMENYLHATYEQNGKDFHFQTRRIAKILGITSHHLKQPLLDLEEKNIIQRYNKSRNRITWKTNFSKTNGGEKDEL